MAAEVLIVDDDVRLSAMLADYLQAAGFQTRVAATGLSGLQEIARLAPDVVVLDVMLPDHDGFEICRRIRAGSNLPILMLYRQGRGDGPDCRIGARARMITFPSPSTRAN